MTKRRLYTLVIPAEAQMRSETETRQEVQDLAAISGAQPVSVATGQFPSGYILEGMYRKNLAEVMATEVEELFSAGGIDTVPFFGLSEDLPEDGFYTLENVTRKRADPREARLQTFDGRLSKEGTTESHFRAVETNPTTVSHDWGNGTDALVSAPATAAQVQWIDPVDGTREDPTLVDTITTEHGDVERYDADAPSIDSPTLIYDVDYAEIGKTDPTLWDDRGVSKTTTAADGTDVVQWAKVFASDHRFSGDPVLSNGKLRVTLDEANGISAERYASGSWSSVSLGTSDWELFDVDVVEVGAAEIHAQLEFVDTTQSPDAYFALDATVKRGFDDLLFVIPPNESGPVPSGLVTLLDPIAATTTRDAQASAGLVARSEVRK